uniref:Uncharacterized protein n=1 Tax=Solanum tuberosum TaxID=4113 RepID=M1DF18_SOLTU
MDISKSTINRMLHGPEYTTPASVGLFEGKYHAMTSETEMQDQSSRERVMRWIAKKIALEGENAAWVTGSQLRPTGNDNTLSPSLASLVACLMDGYPVNVGRIIATEMRDRPLKVLKSSRRSWPRCELKLPVHVPTPVMPECLMNFFSEPTTTQSIDNFWGDLPKRKSGKRKHKSDDFDEEKPSYLSKEENKRNKKAHKKLRKKAREDKTLEEHRSDALLAGASGSAIPPPVLSVQLT